jgi:hypothetical protein
MLTALRSGWFIEPDGTLVEIVAGRTRISPEVLERPGFAEYFEPYISAPGTDSSRSEVRTLGPDGRMYADERF